MRQAASSIALLIGLLSGAHDAHGIAVGARQTETLWRGRFLGDSLYVRATWEATVGESTCKALAHEVEDDSTTLFPHYIDYSVVNGHGGVLWADEVSGPDFWLCCGGLWASAKPWRDGLVISISDEVSPCEPGGMCNYTRYVYLSRAGAVASSGWDWLDWDPAKPGLVSGTARMDCIEYGMTLEPQVHGQLLEFEPRFPPSVREGDLTEQVLDEVSGDGCNRRADAMSASIDLFPTPASTVPTPLRVAPGDRVTLVSVVIRAERGPGDRLSPRVIRYGVEVGDRKGYVTLTSLRTIGYLFSSDVRDPESR